VRRPIRWLSLLEGPAVILTLVATFYLTVAVWHSGDMDIAVYVQYAQAFWHTPPLYTALPREYPPLAIAPFSLTMLYPGQDVNAVFAAGMTAVVLLGYLAMRRWSTRERALVYLGYLFLGEMPVVVGRFDILPALTTLGALMAARRGRFTFAYVFLALGTLLKVYPFALVPVVLIEQWRSSATPSRIRVARDVGFCLGLIALGFALAWLRNPDSAFSSLTYANSRPVQIESLAASLIWLGTHAGIPATNTFTFGSVNWSGPLAGALAPLSTLALIAGCLAIYWSQARGRLAMPYAFLGCVGVLLLTNRVFSSQYLIWMLPLVAEVLGLDLLWIMICVFTALDIGMNPFDLPSYSPTYLQLYFLVLTIRNALLLVATLRLLLPSRRSARPASTERTEVLVGTGRTIGAPAG
jgi:hypothetical protein